MIRRVSLKVAAAGAGLVLAAGVAASAAVGPPEQGDKGLSNAEEQTGKDLPAREKDHPTKEVHPGRGPDAPDDLETDADTDVDGESEGVGPVGNHGAAVSEVARNTTETGRDKGAAVSEVARDNHGHSGEHGPPADDSEDSDDLDSGNGKAKGHDKP